MKNLKDFTIEENKEEAYPFVPINSLFSVFENSKHEEKIIDFAKCSILEEQINVWQKYGYSINATLLQRYLGSGLSDNVGYEIANFIYEGYNSTDPDIQRQYGLTKEISSFGFNIMSDLERNFDAKDRLENHVVNEIAKKYELDAKDKPFFDVFLNHLIETNLGTTSKELENPQLKFTP